MGLLYSRHKYDEMASKYNVEYIAGGKWMLQIPGATSYIGCIGKDKFGEEMKKHSKLAGVNVFMMNLSPPFICEFFKDAQVKVLPYMNFVFGTETDARTVSRVHGWEGADPVVVADDGKIKLFPMILLPKEKLIDTNGAGDAFVGGFLSQLVQEKSIEDCVRAGCYVVNVVIQSFLAGYY
ncbi:hypothetical protein RHSIM_Rhsim04G0145200 [Rhododendron simsii]|uniref:Adenosine kinase n=1 Tax=Rhododendron simsii TaxID=118357 RepID=A0A834LMD9_RHOSS|nr:hypothetical protein RHSIM_Rhsim04G0145200 [Rhododendron simsii]